jgi:hypothetical protein
MLMLSIRFVNRRRSIPQVYPRSGDQGRWLQASDRAATAKDHEHLAVHLEVRLSGVEAGLSGRCHKIQR